MPEDRTIVVTGANGFIGSNLVLRLEEDGHQPRPITRETPAAQAFELLVAADIIVHLAGVNRCDNDEEFTRSNRDFTCRLAKGVANGARKPLVVFSSSTKALEETPYGRSKLAAEEVLLELAASGSATVSIWRLPNVCGKWSRPNYNSAVATFCHNIARGLPIRVDDPSAPLSLIHIDDLIDQWLPLLGDRAPASGYGNPHPVHHSTVGEVAQLIQRFADCRNRGEIPDVGDGLNRVLYASYISALPVGEATYPAAAHSDARGTFVEVLKTRASGQFSYFSAHPGVTRGGHYHHAKVEKFLVAHGTGRFRFRHATNGESFEVVSSAESPLMIETIPGWAHDVTNIGNDELVVLTWANETFDPDRPDTHSMPL